MYNDFTANAKKMYKDNQQTCKRLASDEKLIHIEIEGHVSNKQEPQQHEVNIYIGYSCTLKNGPMSLLILTSHSFLKVSSLGLLGIR